MCALRNAAVTRQAPSGARGNLPNGGAVHPAICRNGVAAHA
jgi:hypothetical protein